MSQLKLNLVVAGTVVALTAGFVFAMMIPGLKEVDEKRVAIDKESAQVKAEQQQVGDIGEVYAAIMSLNHQTSDFHARLPNEQRIGEFLRDVSDQLQKQGVEDYTVQPFDPVRLQSEILPDSMKILAGTTVLPVGITFQCDFRQLFDFLAAMEALPRLSHVESIKISLNNNQAGRIRVELVFQTYSKPD